jgi:hypothetical protein
MMENEAGGARGTHGRGDKSVKDFVGKPEGKTTLGRPRRRWQDGIRINLIVREIGWVCGLVDSLFNDDFSVTLMYNVGKRMSE